MTLMMLMMMMKKKSFLLFKREEGIVPLLASRGTIQLPFFIAFLWKVEIIPFLWSSRLSMEFVIGPPLCSLIHTDNSQRKRKAGAHEKVALLPWAQKMQWHVVHSFGVHTQYKPRQKARPEEKSLLLSLPLLLAQKKKTSRVRKLDQKKSLFFFLIFFLLRRKTSRVRKLDHKKSLFFFLFLFCSEETDRPPEKVRPEEKSLLVLLFLPFLLAPKKKTSRVRKLDQEKSLFFFLFLFLLKKKDKPRQKVRPPGTS